MCCYQELSDGLSHFTEVEKKHTNSCCHHHGHSNKFAVQFVEQDSHKIRTTGLSINCFLKSTCAFLRWDVDR